MTDCIQLAAPPAITTETPVARFLSCVRDERGSILVETAVGFMLVMTMVLGILECCMMSYTYAMLEDATREGVRYASFHGADSALCSGPGTGCGDSVGANVVSDVTVYAATYVPNTSAMTVSVTWPDAASTAASRVRVAILYTYRPLFNYPGATHVLSVSSEGRILY
jgi:Flp pilus assembly protein TadG